MKTIKVEDFLSEIKKEWDCVDCSVFDFSGEKCKCTSYWVSIESVRYVKKGERILFKDWKTNLYHAIPITEPILVDKKQYVDCETTEYTITINSNKEITFETTKML